MSLSSNEPATLSTANIVGSPALSMLGAGFLAQLAQSLATGGLPVGPVGWVTFGLTAISGLLGIFGKA